MHFSMQVSLLVDAFMIETEVELTKMDIVSAPLLMSSLFSMSW